MEQSFGSGDDFVDAPDEQNTTDFVDRMETESIGTITTFSESVKVDDTAKSKNLVEFLETLADPTHTSASFCDEHIGDRECVLIATTLRKQTTGHLLSLDLRGNRIGESGAMALADYLRMNHSLRSLSLEWNSVGCIDTGIQSLASALEINTTLVQLDLRNNDIGPQGGVCIAKALHCNTTLRRLDLRWNQLGVSGGNAIAKAIADHNRTLTECHMSGNRITEEASSVICRCIQRNCAPCQIGAHHKSGPPQSGFLTTTATPSRERSILSIDELTSAAERSVSLEAMLNDLKAELSSVENAYKAESRVRGEVEEKLQRAEQDLRFRSEQMEALNGQLKNELEIQREEVNNIRAELFQVKEQRNQEQLEDSKVKQQLRFDVEREHNLVNEANYKIAQLELENSELRKSQATLQEKIDSLRTVLKTKESQHLEGMKAEKENSSRIQNSLEDEIEQMRTVTNELERTKTENAKVATEQLKTLKLELAEKRLEFENKMKEKSNEFGESLNKVQEQLNLSMEQHSDEVRMLREEYEMNMKNLVGSMESKEDSFKERLNEANQLLNHERAQTRELNRQHGQLQIHLSSNRGRISQLEAELQHLQSCLTTCQENAKLALNEQEARYQHQVRDSFTKLKSAEEQAELFHQKLKDQIEANHMLQNELCNSHARLNTLTERVGLRVQRAIGEVFENLKSEGIDAGAAIYHGTSATLSQRLESNDDVTISQTRIVEKLQEQVDEVDEKTSCSILKVEAKMGCDNRRKSVDAAVSETEFDLIEVADANENSAQVSNDNNCQAAEESGDSPEITTNESGDGLVESEQDQEDSAGHGGTTVEWEDGQVDETEYDKAEAVATLGYDPDDTSEPAKNDQDETAGEIEYDTSESAENDQNDTSEPEENDQDDTSEPAENDQDDTSEPAENDQDGTAGEIEYDTSEPAENKPDDTSEPAENDQDDTSELAEKDQDDTSEPAENDQDDTSELAEKDQDDTSEPAEKVQEETTTDAIQYDLDETTNSDYYQEVEAVYGTECDQNTLSERRKTGNLPDQGGVHLEEKEVDHTDAQNYIEAYDQIDTIEEEDYDDESWSSDDNNNIPTPSYDEENEILSAVESSFNSTYKSIDEQNSIDGEELKEGEDDVIRLY